MHPQLLCEKFLFRYFSDIASTRSTFRLDDIEFNGFAFFGGLVIVHHQGGVVEEVIAAILSADEAESLLFVEHFDCSLHFLLPF